MTLSTATICVNMVNCHVCHGKGQYYERIASIITKKKTRVVCPRCAGEKDFEEECAELVDTSAKHCPACLGTSLLLLSKIIKRVKSQNTESVLP